MAEPASGAPAAPARGGGAIRGIGEKFSANPTTGTGSVKVPIATSPGRSGFGPELTLSYDSGSGNGPFGLGWSLSAPAISRRTDTGVPLYRDDEESDVYLLSGAEDLVPVLEPDGSRFADDTTAPGYVIHRYRPRTEGLFARIERWSHLATGEVHWRSISRDNVTALFGTDAASRVADPADPARVFSWLISQSHDDKGNAIVYEYAAEDGAGVDPSLASERNRVRTAGRYLKRIRYGNRVSRLVQPDLARAEWLFEVVLDYDEGHVEEVALDPSRPADAQHRFTRASPAAGRAWSARPDPTSSHRAGFEVRTHRRCHRVLMFHHVPGLPTGEVGYEGLVRATEIDYADLDYAQPPGIDAELGHRGSTRFVSTIRSITQSGYVRDETQPVLVRDGAEYATYLERSLPPLEFEYRRPVLHDEVLRLDASSVENLPSGIDGSTYQWVDLDGEGVAGVLTEQAGAWFYKPPLGDGRFGPLTTVASTPAPAAPGGEAHRLLDLAGDGQVDVVALGGPTPGFYERRQDEGWETLRPFRHLPQLAWDDPNLRLVDLDGDGHADVLITERDAIRWHPSLAEDGFGAARSVDVSADEERGPRLVLADGEQSIHLADMCGDGLTDLVRIRNGEVCYWPNLGHGRFGPKVALDDAPRFDEPDLFDQRRIRIADIDGSGTSDIVYLARDGARLYFNQAGNRLSAPRRLAGFPPVHDIASVATADLLGTGTACLVWSSALPADAPSPVRYVDLMGGVKPHVLTRYANNLGAETEIHYAPSTRFSLADKRAGRRWITRLPMPVQVVERIVTHDRINRSRFVTRFAYHHGHYDGADREFRGFGMVEQWDTDELAALGGASDVPPVLTRTWFHTGVHLGRDRISTHFAGEYHREQGAGDAEARALLLEDTILPDGLTLDEEREACRALKVAMLRQEVYARDGTEREPHPYVVTEQSHAVRTLQPRGRNRHAIFFAHVGETLTCHYDREPADPRIAHAVTIEMDEFGNALRSAAVGYGRRRPDPTLGAEDQARQNELKVVYAEHRVTNAVDAADAYRTPRTCESRTYALTGLALPAGATRFSLEDLAAAGAAAATIGYESEPGPGALEKRLIEHVRSYGRRDDLTGPLPLGVQQSLGLPFVDCTLAFTPGLLAQVYGDRVDDAMLGGDGGYVHTEGDDGWWVPSRATFYSPGAGDSPAEELAHARGHFFLPHRHRDPFGAESFTTYDGHDLLVREARDSVGNRVTAGERAVDPAQPLVRHGHDYRVLQPVLVMDPNRNRSTVAFDAFGLVVGDAVMGKPEEIPVPGDRLGPGFRADLTQAEIDAFLAAPRGPSAATLLDGATSRVVYDVTAYWRAPDGARRPPVAATLARETHASEPVPTGGLRIQTSLSYSDGFGGVVQKKVQAEDGPVAGHDVSPRWVASGWTVRDNKGNPVRRYEPFFTDTATFEDDVRIGVSALLFYDPGERVVATLHPNRSYEKSVFGPWRSESWDVNDTVLIADPAADPDVGAHFARLEEGEYLPTWHALRTEPAHAQEAAGRWPDPAERAAEARAAAEVAVHAATPLVSHADALGRTFLTVAHTRGRHSNAAPFEALHETRTILDIEGNQRAIVDAEGRTVARYAYDMLANCVHRASMEAGRRWILIDVLGKPIFAWDERGHRFRTEYDTERRQTGSFVREGAGPELLVGQTTYGEGLPDAEARNLRGKGVELRDQAGVVVTDLHDFKGNPQRSRRQLARDHRAMLDWSGPVALEPEAFLSLTRYDALDRPEQIVAPHSNRPGTAVTVVQPSYNAANLLERVDAWLDQAGEPAGPLDAATATLPVLTGVEYDAKGQAARVEYGNGVATTYRHDPLTFRLVHLVTRRGGASPVQSLRYAYDPVGNVASIRDDAQQSTFFRNRHVEPGAHYLYDSGYRLIEATGREHLGQAGGAPIPHSAADGPRAGLLHPGDGNAMGTYVERYVHDAVGNLLSMQHRGSDPLHPGWTRTFAYEEASALDPLQRSNRLTRTVTGGDVGVFSAAGDGYDAHGNLQRMPHLAAMAWDHEDQLRMTQRQVVDGGDAERTYHVYAANGVRVRKVTEGAGGQVTDERIYLDGVELYRRHGSDPLERETLHLTDNLQRRVALVETRTSGAEPGIPRRLIRYQYGNHLGSAALELDDQARIVSYEEYSPYGSSTYQAARSATETPKRYRYCGKERDDESGLYYHGARHYAPWLGRWIACDPKGPARRLCLYEYCDGNPVVLHDPTGADGKPPLPGLIGNDPRLGALWEKAVVEALGPRFKASTYKDVEAAFQAELQERVAAKGMGSNRKPGTGIKFARDMYSNVRTRFGKLAEQSGISLKGLQLHHTFDHLAKNPAAALQTTNLGVQRGHAGVEGSGHNFAHQVDAAHNAGIKHPGQHVAAELHAKGIVPDVPELSPSLQGSSLPKTPNTPHTPRARKGRIGGWVGLAINLGVAAYVFTETNDAYAAGQTLNPAANTTDAAISSERSTWSVAKGIATDAYYFTPLGTLDSVVFGLMGPRGEFRYDKKLYDRAMADKRNPFCAQCHGPGGALDPNNEWNRNARFGVLPTLQQRDDATVLREFLEPAR